MALRRGIELTQLEAAVTDHQPMYWFFDGDYRVATGGGPRQRFTSFGVATTVGDPAHGIIETDQDPVLDMAIVTREHSISTVSSPPLCIEAHADELIRLNIYPDPAPVEVTASIAVHLGDYFGTPMAVQPSLGYALGSPQLGLWLWRAIEFGTFAGGEYGLAQIEAAEQGTPFFCDVLAWRPGVPHRHWGQDWHVHLADQHAFDQARQAGGALGEFRVFLRATQLGAIPYGTAFRSWGSWSHPSPGGLRGATAFSGGAVGGNRVIDRASLVDLGEAVRARAQWGAGSVTDEAFLDVSPGTARASAWASQVGEDDGPYLLQDGRGNLVFSDGVAYHKVLGNLPPVLDGRAYWDGDALAALLFIGDGLFRLRDPSPWVDPNAPAIIGGYYVDPATVHINAAVETVRRVNHW